MNKNKVHFGLIFTLFLTIIIAIGCSKKHTISSFDYGLVTLDTLVQKDSLILKKIEPYKKIIDTEMNFFLGYSKQTLTKSKPEGLLNNFIADLLLYMANEHYNKTDTPFDISLLNYGGLRADIPKGAVSVSNIFSLMPFENEVVVLALNHTDFLRMVDYIINNPGTPFSGMTIRAFGSTLTDLRIQGETIQQDKIYTVVTTDYLAYGGDRMVFLSNPVSKEYLSVKFRDMIISYLNEINKKDILIDAKLDGRIVYE